MAELLADLRDAQRDDELVATPSLFDEDTEHPAPVAAARKRVSLVTTGYLSVPTAVARAVDAPTTSVHPPTFVKVRER